MKIVPVRLKEANAFVGQFHRHNQPIDHRSHRFTVGLEDGGTLVGIGIAGLPIARKLDDGKTLEILRVCVKDGVKNGNSMLYGKLARIGFLMGYDRIITYTLQKECASSLKAVGATLDAELNRTSNSWNVKSRKREHQAVFEEKKYRWTFRKPKEFEPKTEPKCKHGNDKHICSECEESEHEKNLEEEKMKK